MILQDAQELVLETNVRAFVGVHPRVTANKLGLSDDVLPKCVSGDSPKEWWKTQAPTGLQLSLSPAVVCNQAHIHSGGAGLEHFRR
jgi:hypothetical protein